jgi:hypothetical protein
LCLSHPWDLSCLSHPWDLSGLSGHKRAEGMQEADTAVDMVVDRVTSSAGTVADSARVAQVARTM